MYSKETSPQAILAIGMDRDNAPFSITYQAKHTAKRDT